MKVFRHVYDHFEEYLIAFFMALMIFCLMLQVIVRGLWGSSVAWSEELSRFCLIWSVYIGGAMAAKQGAHIRITAQFMKMSVNWRIFFLIVADVLWVGCCLFLAIEGFSVIQSGFEFPEYATTMPIAKPYVEAVIPFSMVLVSWRVIERYVINYKNGTMESMVNYGGE